MKERIIQIMPMGAEYDHIREGDYIKSNTDGSGNVCYAVVGAALMESGRVLPLLWDGWLDFITVDEDRAAGILSVRKMLKQAERKIPTYDQSGAETKTAEEPWEDPAILLECPKDEDSKKAASENNMENQNAPSYWDALTSGEYPRTAEAMKVLLQKGVREK